MSDLKPCPCSPEQRRLTKRSWEAMRARCLSPKHPHFHDYGGRGIGICERWSGFDAFLSDVGPRPSSDRFLDRIDNGGSYEPGNVRWATRIEQHRNKRSNHLITAFGETLTLAEWSERTGLRKETIRMRLTRGWPAQQALTEEPSFDGTRHMSTEQIAERARRMTESRYGKRA